MPQYVKVCSTDSIPPGEVRLVEADGTKIALCHHNGQFYALSNFCPHLTGNLGEGKIEDGLLVCPEHGWRFRLSSGRCVSVANQAAHTFPVKVEQGWILVGL